MAAWRGAELARGAKNGALCLAGGNTSVPYVLLTTNNAQRRIMVVPLPTSGTPVVRRFAITRERPKCGDQALPDSTQCHATPPPSPLNLFPFFMLCSLLFNKEHCPSKAGNHFLLYSYLFLSPFSFSLIQRLLLSFSLRLFYLPRVTFFPLICE